jgi:predicted TIM-barrel fold metal-dependent hydrolase
MISRRDMLAAGLAGLAGMARGRTGARFLMPKASQPATAVAFDVPAGACDCHTHVFGDARRFPMSPARIYTPEPASLDELRALHRALHTSRVVIVQPSIYGTDNACTLDAVRRLGAEARGVAVIDEATSNAALDEMDRGGIRGIRINLATVGQSDPAVARAQLRAAVDRAASRRWHVQIYTELPVIEAIADAVAASPVPVVFDHFGGAQGASGVGQPGFAALLDLVKGGHAYVKLSAPYRSSTRAPDYPDAAPLAQALIAAYPQRMLWGTDWPHPDAARVAGREPADLAPLFQIDDGRMLNLLAQWAPEAATRRTILVDNPARLYGFRAPA